MSAMGGDNDRQGSATTTQSLADKATRLSRIQYIPAPLPRIFICLSYANDLYYGWWPLASADPVTAASSAAVGLLATTSPARPAKLPAALRLAVLVLDIQLPVVRMRLGLDLAPRPLRLAGICFRPLLRWRSVRRALFIEPEVVVW